MMSEAAGAHLGLQIDVLLFGRLPPSQLVQIERVPPSPLTFSSFNLLANYERELERGSLMMSESAGGALRATNESPAIDRLSQLVLI